MTDEAELRAALAAAGPGARLWWRDDDAGHPHPRLDRLLALAERHEAPVALAVVPAWLEPACTAAIRSCGLATVLQHGIAHRNHAPEGERKIELGGSADPSTLRRDLAQGRQDLARAFGARFQPVLVPPWNRIAPALLPRLPGLGFIACSTFWSPRTAPTSMPGLRRLDTHLDLVAWREDSRPLRFAEAASRLANLLRTDLDQPIGILSHHRAMDEDAFAALDRLLAVVQHGPGPKLIGIPSLLRDA